MENINNTEQFGHTSDYHGYGTNEQGVDTERNYLGADYYNAQMGKKANELYAQEEAEMAAENQAFEDEWNAEGEEKERNDKIRLALASAREAIKDANAHLDMIEAMIQKENERAERILAERKGSTIANPSKSAPLPGAEARNDFATMSTQPLDSTEGKNINTASATMPTSEATTNTAEDASYIGKGEVKYTKWEDAINSFQD